MIIRKKNDLLSHDNRNLNQAVLLESCTPEDCTRAMMIHQPTKRHNIRRHHSCFANNKPPPIVIVRSRKSSRKSAMTCLDDTTSWLKRNTSDVSYETKEAQPSTEYDEDERSEYGPHLLSWDSAVFSWRSAAQIKYIFVLRHT